MSVEFDRLMREFKRDMAATVVIAPAIAAEVRTRAVIAAEVWAEDADRGEMDRLAEFLRCNRFDRLGEMEQPWLAFCDVIRPGQGFGRGPLSHEGDSQAWLDAELRASEFWCDEAVIGSAWPAGWVVQAFAETAVKVAAFESLGVLDRSAKA